MWSSHSVEGSAHLTGAMTDEGMVQKWKLALTDWGKARQRTHMVKPEYCHGWKEQAQGQQESGVRGATQGHSLSQATGASLMEQRSPHEPSDSCQIMQQKLIPPLSLHHTQAPGIWYKGQKLPCLGLRLV